VSHVFGYNPASAGHWRGTLCVATLLLPLILWMPMSSPANAQEIVLPASPGALHGTLVDAGSKAPAVLIIAGSGPTDRDGNSPLGVQANTYKLLAEGLAAKGISTLRYDKRGIAASKDAMTAEADLRIQTYADDAAAMAAELRRQTNSECVWLLGHSEGALLAEMVAQHPAGLCGVIIVSGAGRKGADILREQLKPSLPSAMQPAALAALTELQAGHPVPNPPEPAALFRASVQPYLISWLQQDPVALLAHVHLPVLILQGDTDIQVAVSDAKLLAAANADAKLVVLAGMNHVLKSAPLDRAANLATYTDTTLPLAPGVIETIAGFVQQNAR
jgi:pimeloyl-ACP methyl ester carboxylesterase